MPLGLAAAPPGSRVSRRLRCHGPHPPSRCAVTRPAPRSQFVEETLERKCDVSDPSTCDEKEQKFITKMTGKDAAALTKELTRLEGMKEKKMKAEQKGFLFQRIYILTQMTAGDTKEEL